MTKNYEICELNCKIRHPNIQKVKKSLPITRFKNQKNPQNLNHKNKANKGEEAIFEVFFMPMEGDGGTLLNIHQSTKKLLLR